MKLLHSFLKELKLASKSFYFYLEIGIAFLLLFVLMYVIPENFTNKTSEYIYLDLNSNYQEMVLSSIIQNDIDGVSEEKTLKSKGKEIKVELYESEDQKIYITETKEDMISLAETKKKLGAMISIKNNTMYYDYYLQGYESEKYKNVLNAIHVLDFKELETSINEVKVRSLGATQHSLSDRENVLPVFLYYNGSLMGLFIIAAYIFLDKGEGIIKAFAVTASKVWVYLLSKVGVLVLTTVATSSILVIPIMGSQPNYLGLYTLLITSAFFASVIGLIIASYYSNIMQSFGAIYVLIIVLSIPSIAYFIPSWEPAWVKFIPTYPLIQGFKEVLIVNGDIGYALLASLGYLVGGLVLFAFANYRFKKTLTV